MPPILLRITKRRTAWEPGANVQETIETEFMRDGRIDLRPSVYQLEAQNEVVIHAHAEHAANAGLDPPRGGNNVDLSGLQATPMVTNSRFRFTREVHHEVVFQNETELRNFLVTVLANLAARAYSTQKRQLLGYVAQKLNEHDEEWLGFCLDAPNSRKWGCPG